MQGDHLVGDRVEVRQGQGLGERGRVVGHRMGIYTIDLDDGGTVIKTEQQFRNVTTRGEVNVDPERWDGQA